MSRLCRLGVRKLTEKSVLLLGLTAISPLGEYTASAKLAEREGFEHKVRPLKVDLFGSRLSVTFRFAAKMAP
jgi:hypothetical protein